MIGYVVSHLPWAALLLLAAGAVFAVWRYFGDRAAGALAFAILLVFALKKGQEDERERRDVEDTKDTIDAIRDAERIRRESDARNQDPEELVKDDGFKRHEAPVELGPLVSEEVFKRPPAKSLEENTPDDELLTDDGFKRKPE